MRVGGKVIILAHLRLKFFNVGVCELQNIAASLTDLMIMVPVAENMFVMGVALTKADLSHQLTFH